MLKEERNCIIWNDQLKLEKWKNRGNKNVEQRTRAVNKKIINMIDINPNTAIIILNVNDINIAIKGLRLSDCQGG